MAQYSGPDHILQQRQQHFYPCTSHFYRTPPQIVKGEMQYLYDHENRRYTDFFAGVSVVACGHCNPDIVRRTEEQLRTLQHTCTIYLTQPNADLAQRMAEVLPGTLKRSFFVNSGSEANEGALLLARLHTGKRGFIALEQGLHGRTYLTMSVTGLRMWRTDPQLEADRDVTFIPRPYERGMSDDEAAQRSLATLRKVLEEKGGEIAAMIAEPIQGNAGIIVPPAGYFAEVKALLAQHDVLFIADEIQTGFGRTGEMFAIEHYGVQPDIVTMAKALGNGVPVAAFATTDEIAASFNRPSASTFGGNPVSAVTALAVLDYIESHRLVQRSKQLGGILQEGLRSLAARYPQAITEVRGAGLMIGAELCGEDPPRGAVLVDDVLEQMKDRGFIIGKNGVDRNVLAFQPPLVITEEDIAGMLTALEETLRSLI
ncbi:aspartate aminotransferase family protein [Paenibacillus woosongensis]|uniref:alanine--glyoxylate transaminase n=1 Tax=Paenibacillus woosongensis TaxID=307580 RepID=A0AA95L1E4_9BACL|nr:aspartate aminotransferase family protein [Paenibacillus woosongensis]WHX49779.1 aspartate aminotransferase family protein [Paenibacillus woosongensis]